MILIELNIKTELILFWFFFSLSIEDGNLYYAQVNLVNNPGFEDFISCSDCNQNITEATYWFQPNQWDWPNGGSDFYHTCNLNCTPPLIVSGYQNPRSGNGFGGGGYFIQL